MERLRGDLWLRCSEYQGGYGEVKKKLCFSILTILWIFCQHKICCTKEIVFFKNTHWNSLKGQNVRVWPLLSLKKILWRKKDWGCTEAPVWRRQRGGSPRRTRGPNAEANRWAVKRRFAIFGELSSSPSPSPVKVCCWPEGWQSIIAEIITLSKCNLRLIIFSPEAPPIPLTEGGKVGLQAEPMWPPIWGWEFKYATIFQFW